MIRIEITIRLLAVILLMVFSAFLIKSLSPLGLEKPLVLAAISFAAGDLSAKLNRKAKKLIKAYKGASEDEAGQ